MPGSNETDVVVIGAGISGLTVAHCLKRRGMQVRVLEKSSRVGGTIHTGSVDGFLVEYGPNSALETSPNLGQLFDETGVADSLVYAADTAKNRYIVKHGQLNALPMSPPAFLRTRLFSAGAKLRLLKEPFVKPLPDGTDESMADFVRRRLGNEFLDYAIDPFVSGVYAGDPEQLSVRSSFAKLAELEHDYGSLIKGAIKGAKARKARAAQGERSKSAARMFSFGAGMETLVRGLANELGDAVHTEAEPIAVRAMGDGYAVDLRTRSGEETFACRAVVLAIPAYAYPAIELPQDEGLSDTLSHIGYPPVTVVFFGFNRTPAGVNADGFGFLVPKKENRRILGTIWNSSIFPGRTPDGGLALTTFVGGARQPDVALLGTSELVDVVRAEVRDLMGVGTAPDVVATHVWKRAIPQYNVGHYRIVEIIKNFEHRNHGVFVSGNFRGGVSLSDCISNGFSMATRVAEQLGIDGAGGEGQDGGHGGKGVGEGIEVE